jgi:hypothetical protein
VEYLKPYGFVISTFDPCVLIHSSGELFMSIYVDDITLFGESNKLLDQTVDVLKTEFKVNDMGHIHWLLAIQIDFTNTGITLTQTSFINSILHRFKMQDCKPVATPIDHDHHLVKARDGDERANATIYQQMIGSLMYLVTATRPDLAYTITHLSQFNSDPTISHLKAAKRVLRYLQGTKDFKLVYPWKSNMELSGYADSSYGNCLDTRRSFSGYVFKLGGSAISWRSRKQRSVATSTCEAEYMALAMAAKQFQWLQRGIRELLNYDKLPSALFCDNNSAIDISYNPKLNDRTKHIDIAYHFTRELVQEGTLTLLPVSSADNIADICTKGLARQTHNHLCAIIFGTK